MNLERVGLGVREEVEQCRKRKREAEEKLRHFEEDLKNVKVYSLFTLACVRIQYGILRKKLNIKKESTTWYVVGIKINKVEEKSKLMNYSNILL